MPALAVTAYVSMFILGLIDNARGPFYPEVLAEFGVSTFKGSLFFALTSLFAFLGSMVSHRLSRGRSQFQLLVGASIGFSLGFCAIGAAPAWFWLCSACAFFGLFFGGLNVAQNTLVMENSRPEKRRRMLSGLHGMYALAALCAPLMVNGFRLLGFGWRGTFLLLSLFPWLLLVALAFVRSSGQTRPVTGGGVSAANSGGPAPPIDWTAAWFFALVSAGYLWGEIALSTRLVQWLRAELGFAPSAANLYLGLFFALFLCGRVVFSAVGFSRWSNWHVLLGSSALAAALVGMGLAVHPVFMAVSGFAMAPFYPAIMAQVHSRFSAHGHGVLGFVIGFGSLSVVVMQVLFGWAADRWGLTRAFNLSVLGLALVFIALLFRSRFDRAT